jgi:hypothetical protein
MDKGKFFLGIIKEYLWRDLMEIYLIIIHISGSACADPLQTKIPGSVPGIFKNIFSPQIPRYLTGGKYDKQNYPKL